MITVYVLESIADSIHYVGMCQDLDIRLKQHNSGKSKFTKGHMPWKVIYSEAHPDWKTARSREKYFKSASGRNWLKRHIQNT